MKFIVLLFCSSLILNACHPDAPQIFIDKDNATIFYSNQSVSSYTRNQSQFTNKNIWNNSSQELLISIDLGNSATLEKRYEFYSFKKKQLSLIVLDFLSAITTQEGNTFCTRHSAKYSISISDGLSNKVYHSSNNACIKNSKKQFISTEDFQRLMELL